MARENADGENGQGLAYVLVVSAALLIFLVALVDILRKDMKWTISGQRSAMLMHEADGAADRAMYAIQKEGNWDGIPTGAVKGYNFDYTYTDVPGVAYKLKVQEGNWTPGYEIGDHENMRTITVLATLTPTGQHRRLQVVVLKSTLNSALFSGGVIFIGGNGDIHWGPVVSYATQSDAMQLKTIPATATYLAVGGILIGTGAKQDSAENLSLDSSNPTAGLSVDAHCTACGSPPYVPLDYYKSVANALTASGTQYYFGNDGVCDPPSNIPVNTSDKTVVFYDTTDGKPYTGQCVGGNGVDLKFAGSACGHGVLVVMGNLTFVGNGCPMGLTMTHPPDCIPRYGDAAECTDIPTPTLMWDGFIYVEGQIDCNGTKKVYGSVYSKHQAAMSGNLDIWYKSDNVSIGMLGQTLGVLLWMPRTPHPQDVANEPYP